MVTVIQDYQSKLYFNLCKLGRHGCSQGWYVIQAGQITVGHQIVGPSNDSDHQLDPD